ncbi:hypothetical protein ABIA31_002911 [Catenulispora sp. MAP5-51]|uniref:hypothetical protein n=1 Tax=Catenulispora sp. MAP5-51 TaxID=3156298 RepID=UPI00351174FA
MYYLGAVYTVRTATVREWLQGQLTGPDRDRGDVPGNVIWMAGIALLAIIVVGIITDKVIGKAHSINLDGSTAPAQ